MSVAVDPALEFRAGRITVTLGVPPTDRPTESDATATVEVDAPEAVAQVLGTLAGGVLPECIEVTEANACFLGDPEIDEHRRLRNPKLILPLKLFPEDFQSFLIGEQRRLSDAISKVARVLQWRYNVHGTHRAIVASGPTQWSPDGEEWHTVPTGLDGRATIRRAVSPSADERDWIEASVEGELEQPLGRNLFLEARNNRYTSPRTALVLAVTALEIEVKRYIAQVVPESQWLVDHLPSPPVDQLLRHYLPTLCHPASQRRFPPSTTTKKVLGSVTEAMQDRNKALHGGVPVVNDNRLEQFLQAIDDVLWLIDYCRGQDWAAQYISGDMRGSLGV